MWKPNTRNGSYTELGYYYISVSPDRFGKWSGVVEYEARDIVIVVECNSEEEAKKRLLNGFASHIKASILGKQLLLNSVNELIKKE